MWFVLGEFIRALLQFLYAHHSNRSLPPPIYANELRNSAKAKYLTCVRHTKTAIEDLSSFGGHGMVSCRAHIMIDICFPICAEEVQQPGFPIYSGGLLGILTILSSNPTLYTCMTSNLRCVGQLVDINLLP